MRVQGNVYPEMATVEPFLPKPGMAEVRLRENVVQLEDTLYEYDEYTTRLKNRPGLRDDINANLADWLVTLRTLEVSENASIVVAQQRDINAANAQNAELLETMATMVEEVYESDLAVFEEG